MDEDFPEGDTQLHHYVFGVNCSVSTSNGCSMIVVC